MAHTERDSDPPAPAGIIQQKPPPPPGYKAPDGDQTIDPPAPIDPQAPAPSAPQEAPPQQPIAPRVAGTHGAGPVSSPGRRIGRKASGPHLIVSPDLKPEIISAGSMRPRASSSPELMLLGFPSRHATPARSSLSR